MLNALKTTGLMAMLAVASVFTSTPGMAAVGNTVTISDDFGGSVIEYYQKYAQLRKDGVNIKVDGLCISACTEILGIIPQDRICTTDYSRLGFHTASIDQGAGPQYSLTGSQFVFSFYPPDVINILKSLGLTADKPHPDVLFLPTKLFYKVCDGS